MVDPLNYWTTILKNIDTARAYIGGSKYAGYFRAENDSHFVKKPKGFSVGEIINVKSIASVREAESHAIRTVMEICGEDKLINMTGGGGGYQEEFEDIPMYYVYILFYLNNQEAIEMSKMKKTNDLSITIKYLPKENLCLMEREVGFLLGAPLYQNINSSTPGTLKFARFFGYEIK